jgi:DNA polymerase
MLNLPIINDKEDVLTVIKDLSTECFDCRLGYIQEKNRGLVHRGNPQARIALISEMPGPKEMIKGKPLVGASGQLSDKWFSYIGLNTNEHMWVCNIVQCKPPDVTKKDETSQRDPDITEIAACFPNRCLRVLKAMPNLEIIITMGWVAACAFMGQKVGEKSHMGSWNISSLVPGKAIFCLPHPASMLRDPNPDQEGKLVECLDNFKREYIDTTKIKDLLSCQKPL